MISSSILDFLLMGLLPSRLESDMLWTFFLVLPLGGEVMLFSSIVGQLIVVSILVISPNDSRSGSISHSVVSFSLVLRTRSLSPRIILVLSLGSYFLAMNVSLKRSENLL